MNQVAISDHIFEKLQLAASNQHLTINELVDQVLEEYLAEDEYCEENDPAIGLIHGPGDLSVRAKEILEAEITSQSGWTQKSIKS